MGAALRRMGKGKAIGMDEIPIEVWYCLREDGIRWLTNLFNKILRMAKMPSMRLIRSKTEYMWENFNGEINELEVKVCIAEDKVPMINIFKYLGMVIDNVGDVRADFTHRIKAIWLKWRAAIGVLCDRNVPLKLKGKFYRAAVRPALLYCSECWPLRKVQKRGLETTEMCMLRWMCGHTMEDHILNDTFRD
ncbi:uncharacterized protein LOC141713513 [Apium graveolens]|uniref:uncharacterized protein LOC141713513 n=1 Tax=Apium graveolens TaxID=4045 RepID=UPI003D7BE2C8